MALQTSIDLNSQTPAPPAQEQNIAFQADAAGNITAHDPVFVGDTGQGGKAGNVPPPQPGDAAAGKFLRADGKFAVPEGSGGDGTAIKSFTFTQNLPSDTWVIEHKLGTYPTVTIVDSAGSLVYGGVQFDSLDQVTVTFSGAFSGTAVCK